MLGERSPRNSWVVSKATGLPTGYTKSQLDPALENSLLITRADELRRILGTSPPEASAPLMRPRTLGLSATGPSRTGIGRKWEGNFISENANPVVTVSVDLAYRAWGDIGVTCMRADRETLTATVLPLRGRGHPEPRHLAAVLVELCRTHGSHTLLMDGPQGWKSNKSDVRDSRVCERDLNTPGKAGLPGHVSPANYLAFFKFSIAVFDELTLLGWRRFTGKEDARTNVVAESFPASAWRALGLPMLPAKAKCTQEALEIHQRLLSTATGVRLTCAPSHD